MLGTGRRDKDNARRELQLLRLLLAGEDDTEQDESLADNHLIMENLYNGLASHREDNNRIMGSLYNDTSPVDVLQSDVASDMCKMKRCVSSGCLFDNGKLTQRTGKSPRG